MEKFFLVGIVVSLLMLLLTSIQYRSTGNATFLKLSTMTVVLCVMGFVVTHQAKL